MSFTTGRRPNSTRAWNFLNHIRQAECDAMPGVQLSGTPLLGTRHRGGVSFRDLPPGDSGGSAQCCTDCHASKGCAGWHMHSHTCLLFSALDAASHAPCANDGAAVCISGKGRGMMPKWTTLPQHLREQGWLTLGVGKYFHDTNRGLGVLGDARYPAGAGLPPEADPSSWSNVSVQNRDLQEQQRRYGRHLQLFKGSAYTGGAGHGYVDTLDGCSADINDKVELCSAELPASGSNAADTSVPPPCDYVAYSDAKEKLRFAAANRAATGQGFLLVVGIRRPHLTWRVPKPYADLYPAAEVALPVQATLDRSIDPIAWTAWEDLGGNQPYVRTNTDAQVRSYRAAYYAAVSWADFAAGEVLAELEALKLDSSTLVVMHSDHGWHLGEYNMWEKRTLWENAARVPLVLRAPWLPQSAGARVAAPVELVDIFKTVCDALGIGLPVGDTHPVEGSSLLPLLRAPGTAAPPGWTKDVALTSYPRCPQPGLPDWEQNDCIHSVERSSFGYMGYSMLYRNPTDATTLRYTEWLKWNGTALRPLLAPDALKAVELYNHTTPLPAGASNFDAYENVNLAPGADPALLRKLSTKLRAEFALHGGDLRRTH